MKKLKLIKFISAFSVVCLLSASAVTVSAAETGGMFSAVAADDSIYEIYDDGNKTDNSLPTSYSSVELGFVTPIKSQNYLDCWAYAAAEVFETKLLREGYDIGNMSVNHLNVWATKRLDGKGWQRTISSDGYNMISPGYFTSWYGGILEADVEDFDLSGDINGDLALNDYTRFGTTSIRYLSKNDPSAIKLAIMDNGGAYTAYAQASRCSNGVSYYMWNSYGSSYTGHAVEVVGWDDEYSRMNFGNSESTRPKNDGAWLVRNSWGNYNSLGGYFWISYEDKYIFDSKYDPSYSIESVIETGGSIKLKQNEIYGATYEFGYALDDDIVFMNRFKFTDGYGVIDKVMFETTCDGADYTIYFVPVENGAPVAEQSEWTSLYSGKVDYKGYICADIEDYCVDSAEGAVAVRIDASAINDGIAHDDENYKNSSIGVGEWLKSNGNYIFINDSEYGDSYIMYDEKLYDLLDWYKIFNNDDIGGTFVIKAVMLEGGGRRIGDVNLDGEISIDDATEIQKHIANIIEISGESLDNADVNFDGSVDIDDVTAIQKHIAGIQEL